MPFAAIHHNHLGTMHAVAQFGLAEAASAQWRSVADQIRPKVPKLATIMDEAEPDVLAYIAFPKGHRAKLHSTDFEKIGLGDYGKPGDYCARQIARWSKQYKLSETEHNPQMERLIEWLPAHIPASARDESQTSIVHGDFRRVHRSGLIACVYRASEWRHKAVELAAHDLLQQFKLHPLVKKILEGGERVSWGAKALPGGGYLVSRAEDCNFVYKDARLFSFSREQAGAARALAERVKDSLGTVIVENKPGAGGNLGADLAAKAAPDGTTIVMGAVATHAINPWLYRTIPYDPIRDFTPITLVAQVPNVLVMNPATADRLGIRGVADLVAEGYVGRVHHINMRYYTAYAFDTAYTWRHPSRSLTQRKRRPPSMNSASSTSTCSR